MFNKISNLLNENGIKYWEYREQDIDVTSVSAWNNQIKDFDLGNKRGYSIRILFGNGWGFCYSDKDGIKNNVLKALKIAKLMDKNTKDKKEIHPYKTITKNVKSDWKINNDDISLEEKKKLVIDNSKVELKEVKNSLVNYNEIDKKLLYINSEGSQIQQQLRYTYTGASITTKKNDRIENFFDRLGRLSGYEITKDLPKLVSNSTKKAIEMLDSKLPKSGNMPVICDGALTDVFIHEALGHACEADQVMQNSSCLKGLSENKIAPDFVSVYDDARMKGLWGSYFFDDEGIPAQKTTLIENGVLKGFMHSRETASLLNAKPTGNARAQSAGFLPQVRMSNTYIKKGKYEFSELLKKVKNGVYLKGSVGGQVDPTTGNFTFSAQEGFEVKNGEILNRLRGVSLSGKTLETLKNISMLSNKYEPSFAGHCGKGGQSVPVYGPCPSILLKKALIGGM